MAQGESWHKRRRHPH